MIGGGAVRYAVCNFVQEPVPLPAFLDFILNLGITARACWRWLVKGFTEIDQVGRIGRWGLTAVSPSLEGFRTRGCRDFVRGGWEGFARVLV